MSPACKLQPSRLSEGITIRCLKFGTGRGSNAITAALWTRSALERALSPRLCSCPQEIYSLDQYVSHPTHDSHSPGSQAVIPVAREGLLEASPPCTGSPPPPRKCPALARIKMLPSQELPPNILLRRRSAVSYTSQSVSQSACAFRRQIFSHTSPWYGSDVLRIAINAQESDNFAHPTLGTRRSAISNPVRGVGVLSVG